MGAKVAVARPAGPEGSAKIRLRLMPASERYAFAEFTLDATERRLSRDGQPIALEPKTHDVLVALVRHAGRLVTKRELLDSGLAGILRRRRHPHRSHFKSSQGARGRGSPARRTSKPFPDRDTASSVRSRNRSARSRRRLANAARWRCCLRGLSPPRFCRNVIEISGWRFRICSSTGWVRSTQLVVRPTRAVHTYTRGGEDPAVVGRSLRVDAVIDMLFHQDRRSARAVRAPPSLAGRNPLRGAPALISPWRT